MDGIRRVLLAEEQRLIAIRRATVSDQPTKQTRIAAVRQPQGVILDRVNRLIRSYWRQQEPTRRQLLRDYLGVLETAKLVTDDVFVEAVHQARLAHGNEELDKARATYRETLIAWARGSPLLNPRTTNGNERFIQIPPSYLGLPRGMRQLASPFGDVFWTVTADGPVEFRTRVRQVAEAEVRAIRRDPSIESFTRETVHLLGLLCLRAQIELSAWTTGDTVDRQNVADWYVATGRLVEQLREDVLDVLGPPVRQALATGDTQLAARLADVEARYLRGLAHIYSVRNLDAAVLITYFVRAARGKFATEAEAVGVNETVEAVSEYAGNPNPDGLDIVDDTKTVDGLLASAKELLGKRVRVAGVFHAAASTVSSDTSKQRVAVELARPSLAPIFTGRNNHVVVVGTLTGQPTAPTILTASIEPWSIPYVSAVGSPMRKDQPDEKTPLQLTPRWRSHTVALEMESRVELQDTSLPVTLTGQQAAVADVLRRPEVVRLFGAQLASSERKTLDLTDVATRSKIWRTVFAGLVRTSQSTALDNLFALVQEYLTAYTRHTYLNMRDSGRNYLDSPWPTDITGSSFYDCGVYALQIARDLHAAVHSSPVTIEFRFMTFLNHVCLIGYVDNKVFLANNATLHPPRLMKKSGRQPDRQRREQAGLDWAPEAFATVHRVQYTIFPATIPRFGVSTSLGEPVFSKRLWSVFLRSIGWGIVGDGAADYFKAIKRFDRAAVAVRAILNQPSAKRDLDKATMLGNDLYELARILAGRKPPAGEGAAATWYLVYEHPFPPESFFTTIGGAAPKGERLPMYDLVDLLKRRAHLTPEQRLLAGNPVDEAHWNKLIDDLLAELGGK